MPVRHRGSAVILLIFIAVFISYIDRTNISVAAIAMQAQYGWSEKSKGLVLSSFFVGYLLCMVPSGVLATRFGGRVLLGIAALWWSAFTALTPLAATASIGALIAARIALGMGESAVFPGMISLVGQWVPAERRSSAVAITISAISLGTLFSLPITGYLVHAYGWPMPFYLFGSLGLLWAVAWFSGTGGRGPYTDTEASERAAVPWLKLLGTRAVWAVFAAHFSSNWSLYLLVAWLPSYFKTTFGVSVAQAGLVSAAPWLVYFISSNVAGIMVDRRLRASASPTRVRKLALTISLGGVTVALLALPTVHSLNGALLATCCLAGSLGTCIPAFAPNCFEIAPRFAAVIFGMSNAVGTLPGIVGVYVTGALVDRTGSFASPFILDAGITLAGLGLYLALGSAQRQIA